MPELERTMLLDSSTTSTCILLTILSLSFLGEGNFREKTPHYAVSLIGGVIFLLLVILSEWKGRRALFTALFLLSISSSVALLIDKIAVIGDSLQTAVQTATVALTGAVLCEYSDPRPRFIRLILNSAILRISYFIYWATFDSPGVTYFIQYFKIVLGIICLASILIWPESPYWLASKERFEESRLAFFSVRTDSSESANELEILTEEQSRVGVARMISDPLLMGIPIIFAISINLKIIENYFHLYVTTIATDQNWLYLLLNILITVVNIFFALKLPRRLLIFLPSVTSFICVYYIAMKQMLAHYVSEDLAKFYELELPFFYLMTMSGIAIINYPIIIEMIPNKYCSVISTILGFMYLIGELCSPYFDGLALLWIIVCLIVNSVFALFLMPEARHRSMIEIELGYLPKKIVFEPATV